MKCKNIGNPDVQDCVDSLKRQVANHKQEEETLLTEMEVTGQAFEDMQEQNARYFLITFYSNCLLVTLSLGFSCTLVRNTLTASRLIQQLREKDDANFKLMSERIKANQEHNPDLTQLVTAERIFFLGGGLKKMEIFFRNIYFDLKREICFWFFC